MNECSTNTKSLIIWRNWIHELGNGLNKLVEEILVKKLLVVLKIKSFTCFTHKPWEKHPWDLGLLPKRTGKLFVGIEHVW